MKAFRWSEGKNTELEQARGVRFEQLLEGRLLAMEQHRDKPHQRLMFIEYEKYVWVVPFVEEEHYIFLKTAFPSRKHTQKFLGKAGGYHEEG